MLRGPTTEGWKKLLVCETMPECHEVGLLRPEVAVPIDAALGRKLQQSESPDFTVYQLPAETVASVVYPYSKEAMPAVYEAIGLWVYSNGYRYVGSCREVYLHDDEPLRGQEEIQFPVEKA